MELYVVVVFPYDDDPYVWSDSTCSGDAYSSASEAYHETGFRAVVKTIRLHTFSGYHDEKESK
tara:strand:- start:1279 stop:1467 length:189 start_codon:yes stop_codon:yes gene_type:complete